MSYLNSKVSVEIDVTDHEQFTADEAPPLEEIDTLVAGDIEDILRNYFTAHGAYPATVNQLDVKVTHSVVGPTEPAEVAA